MPAQFTATKEILKAVFDTLKKENLIDGMDHVDPEDKRVLYNYLCEQVDEIIERRML
jgi:hypothetical protein